MDRLELKYKIEAIAQSLRLIEDKLKSLAETDRLAYHTLHKEYTKLDQECLDLMAKLEATPPDHSHTCSIC